MAGTQLPKLLLPASASARSYFWEGKEADLRTPVWDMSILTSILTILTILTIGVNACPYFQFFEEPPYLPFYLKFFFIFFFERQDGGGCGGAVAVEEETELTFICWFTFQMPLTAKTGPG